MHDVKSQALIVKSDKKLVKILTDEIYYLEAFGDYVKIHLEDKFVLTNSTLSNIFKKLTDTDFKQVHKSFIVKMVKIQAIEGNLILLKNAKIPIGQKYRLEFIEKFRNG